jgi:ElaB/YqjD/DUF883 family membrane-anchored ribosome-binding protein
MASPEVSPPPSGGSEDGHSDCQCHQIYEEVCRQAAKQFERVRQIEAGKLLDGALELVRKHPGCGVAVAALAGFCLGRMWRR